MTEPAVLYTREKRFKTRSERGTLLIAETIAEMLPAPHVVLLIGDLGAGKTTLAKGWVEALGGGSANEVTSPTFTLVHEYQAREYQGRAVKVFHLDVYRLEQERELDALGLDEMAASAGALLLIEWGEKFPRLRRLATAEVRMEALDGDERSLLVRWRD